MSAVADRLVERLAERGMPVFYLVRIVASKIAEADWQRKDLHATAEGYRLVIEREGQTVEILFNVMS